MERYFKLYNSLLWGVCAIVFGILLIKWQRDFLQTIILVAGIISLVVALAQIISFAMMKSKVNLKWSQIPAAPFFALIIGLLLVVSPLLWVDIMVRVVGVVIILLSVNQVITMVGARRKGYDVSVWLFVFPVVMFLAGVLVLFEPLFIADWIVVFAGCLFIAYGLLEVVSYFVVKKIDK
ncbi:MAG: DUF308 domain-containing protein [Mucinivorans sp.]